MNSTTAPPLFEQDHDWLVRQPGMQPWDAGCDRLVRQQAEWLGVYSPAACGEVVDAAHPAHGAYLRRLWACWSYHWRAAAAEDAGGAADGWKVAEAVRAGRGRSGGGRLGGDVFRDVVLAEAVLQRHGVAAEVFDEEYREFAVRQAAAVNKAAAGDPDWWHDLLDRLAGYTRPPGKLASYQGKCGLRNWLGTVVRNYVHDLQAASAESLDFVEEAASYHQPDDGLISRECLELFQPLLQGALAQVKASDRLLLTLLFSHRVNGKEAAAILRIAPGNVSRRKDKALEALRVSLEQGEGAGHARGRELQDCLGHLLHGAQRRTFGQVLVDALETSARGIGP